MNLCPVVSTIRANKYIQHIAGSQLVDTLQMVVSVVVSRMELLGVRLNIKMSS